MRCEEVHTKDNSSVIEDRVEMLSTNSVAAIAAHERRHYSTPRLGRLTARPWRAPSAWPLPPATLAAIIEMAPHIQNTSRIASIMDGTLSFGRYLKQRRKALDLTQQELANLVGCAPETLRKIEADRLRPSRQIAWRLADQLVIPADERDRFVQLARTGIRSAAASTTVPYLGLNTFQEPDALYFFGRETLIETLCDRIDREPMVMIMGPSGCGKSSVVQAGLLPALKRRHGAASERWCTVVLTPGSGPLATLSTALSAALAYEPEDMAISQALQQRGGLRQITDLLAIDRLIVVVDQFEEVWTHCPAGDEREAFLRAILGDTAGSAGRLSIILALRADFLHRAAEHADLVQLINQHTVLLS